MEDAPPLDPSDIGFALKVMEYWKLNDDDNAMRSENLRLSVAELNKISQTIRSKV
jgi:hypothetical protein